MTANPQQVYNPFASAGEVNKTFTLLLKGAPGSRKTTLALNFPDPIIFPFDNNLKPLDWLSPEQRAKVKVMYPSRNVKDGTEVPRVKIWDNFVEQLKLALALPKKHTIIIDSLSTLGEILSDKILKTDNPAVALEIQQWGEISRYWKWLGDYLLLANDLDKNVIMIAHERLVEGKRGEPSRWVLNLGGSMRDNYDLYFTDCWRTYALTDIAGKTQFKARVQPTLVANAKCSLKLPDEFVVEAQLPDILKQVTS
jgi:hypothetical protein